MKTTFKNKEGENYFCAKQEMCPIDLVTRKIRKVNTVNYPSNMETEENIIYEPFFKLTADFSEDDLVYKQKVFLTDIDYSRHTNNVSYVKFIMNTLSSEFIDRYQITDFEIHYINGLFKIQIPTLPSRGIKKDSDLKAIEDAVHNAIERFFEHNVEIAAQARKFAGKKYVVHEQYVLPVSETIDIDRIDFSNIIDMLSIEFCYGYDDSDYLRKHVQTVKNWGTRSYANLYIVLEDEYKEKLEWIERDL